MLVMLLDVGSTFMKYMVYSCKTQTACFSDKVPFPQPVVDDGTKFEVSLEAIKKALMDVACVALQYGCKRAFISVQMHGYVLRRADGTMSNYISWRDRRGNIDDHRLQGVDFLQCGTALKCNLPVASLCAFGAQFFQTEFFTLGSYISYLLTGRNITHKTDACASGFYHAEHLGRISLFPELTLPAVCDTVRAVGRYQDMEIYSPVGDHQASFLGSGAGSQRYFLNIGTASQISALGDRALPGDGCEKRPYFTKQQRLFTVSGLTGGNALFAGADQTLFFQEVLKATEKLPKKTELLLGGGGAQMVYPALKRFAKQHHMSCSIAADNPGVEGLKMIANEQKQIQAGTMLSEINFPNFPVLLKNCGVDFLIVDNEHGAFDFSVMAALLSNAKLCGLQTIVRLPDNGRALITKFADMGAQGFLLPMTNTAEDIRKVVMYAKYMPVGKRGISTNRAHTLYNPPALQSYMKAANESMKLFAQIETKQGCENIADIIQTEGVEGVFIGPNDLSADLNCIGDNRPILPYIEKIGTAAKQAGKVWGIITTDKELIAHSLRFGADMVSYGSEINMLKSGSKHIREMMLW